MSSAAAVRYAFIESPFGRLLVATTAKGVVRVGFPEEDPGALLHQLEDRISDRVEEARVPEIERELDSYFAGRATGFTTRADLGMVPEGFGRRVLKATARVPYGKTSTYGEVAEEAGSPRGARAAGNALNGNPVPIFVPCHRVVPASGGIGGYAGHEERKAFLLELESGAAHRR